MKFLIVLSLVLVSALAYETSNNNNNNNNNPSYDNSNEWDASPRNGGNSVNGRRTPTDINGLTAESLGDMFQRQSQQRGHQRGQHGPGSMNNNNQNGNNNGNNDDETSSLGYWASYPDSAAFDAKIKARLSTSRALSDKPEVRRKITQLAEEKFNQCKVLTDDRERACLGRVTGQIMQLVSAVENMTRNPQ
ncbi:ras-related protein RabX-like [Episyrphus balteatus]|uniref:ras-related protein RabX-like n=1 Tax=Episyrphus balteatus TaxID=286459 RepID=UPI0024855D2D|nr:ras-related protein RabX-like [Episyrphus balteatus]